MKTVEEFDPQPATELWLTIKKRKSHSSIKGRKQNWFRGVFTGAGVEYNRQPKIHF